MTRQESLEAVHTHTHTHTYFYKTNNIIEKKYISDEVYSINSAKNKKDGICSIEQMLCTPSFLCILKF